LKKIELLDINKTYSGRGGTVKALTNVSMNIEEGEMIAVMGPSGSGKSTLLNIIGLTDVSTGGEYLLNHKKIGDYGANEIAKLRNKTFGFVLQDFALVERYTVEQNLKLPLIYSDLPKREWAKKIDAMLISLDIHDKKKTYPPYLSGGQRQRVAIARALINDAEIILADEPTGALDSNTGDEIMRIFTDISAERNTTIIIVTHDIKIAGGCRRIVTLIDGEIG
jgi:putative ABC transport system ATP-binding protein